MLETDPENPAIKIVVSKPVDLSQNLKPLAKLIVNTKFIFVFTTTLLTWHHHAHAAAKDPKTCALSFTEAQTRYAGYPDNSIFHFTDKVASNQQNSNVILPKFDSIANEQKAETTWKGTKSYRMFRELLPNKMFFVGHQLLGSMGPAFVKTDAIELASLRYQTEWKGQKTGFNVIVNATALAENYASSQKDLVREESKAVIVFLHGGGTKGTGSHVAANILGFMKYKGVDVVGVDLPWHAEGSRYSFRDHKDYFEFLRTFIRENISPSGKPVILVGHSMGGLLANLYRQTYSREDKLIQAVVPLSPVLDTAPGHDVIAKVEALAKNEKQNAHLMREDERGFGQSFVLKDKLAPTSYIFIFNMWRALDATKKSDDAKRMMPGLYIVGGADSLILGMEDQVKDYLTHTGAEYIIYGPSMDFTGAVEPVGHLLFDHYHSRVRYEKNEKGEIKLKNNEPVRMNEPATFTDIYEFIARTFNFSPETEIKPDQSIGLLTNITQNYANNLAFRLFLDRTKVLLRTNNPTTEPIGRFMEDIAKLRNKTDLSDAQKAEILEKISKEHFGQNFTYQMAWDLSQRFLKAKKLELNANEETIALGKEYKEVKAMASQLDTQSKKGFAELETLNTQLKKLKKQITTQINEALKNEESLSPEIKKLKVELDTAMKKAVDANVDMDYLNAKFVNEITFRDKHTNKDLEKIPDYLKMANFRSAHQVKNYRNKQQKFDAIFLDYLSKESSQAALHGLLAQQDVLLEKTSTLLNELKEVQKLYQSLRQREDEIYIYYLNKYASEFIKVDQVPASQVFNNPAKDWAENTSILQQILTDWNNINRAKPPVEAPELY